MDGKQQLRGLRPGRSCTLGGCCGHIKAFPRLQRDIIGVLLQPLEQCRGRRCGNIFFFHDSPCARVAAAVPGVDRHAVWRVTDLRTEVVV